jgi:hypothetical protein
MSHTSHVSVGMRKGPEVYAVAFHDQESKKEVMRIIGRWASNGNLNLTLGDAVSLNRSVLLAAEDLRDE